MSALSRQLRRVTRLLLIGAGAVASAQPRPSDPGQVFDRVVAVVKPDRTAASSPAESVITLSDLKFEAAIVLIQRGGRNAAVEELSGEALGGALDYAISQRLHAQEADKLRIFSVQPQELDAAEADFAAQLGGNPALDRFLQRHEMDRNDLRRVLERSLRAARTLDSRVRLRAQVGESEVRRYYEQMVEQARTDTLTAAPAPYEELRGSIREKLFRERYNALAKDETRRLREEADVRILVALGAGEGA